MPLSAYNMYFAEKDTKKVSTYARWYSYLRFFLSLNSRGMLHNWELGEQVHFLHTQNLAGHILSENHAFNSKSVLHTSCCTDPCFPGPVRARQCMPAYIVNWGNNFPQETLHDGLCFSRRVFFCTFLRWNYIVALYGPR